MAAPQPVSSPRNCCCFMLLRKLLWNCCWGKRRFLCSPRCQCHWAVAGWGNISGLSDTWEVFHQSSKNYLIQSMFTRPLLALYLTAVIYPRLSGSAPALADTLLFCSQFTFGRKFLDLFTKGSFCISLCVKHSFLVFLYTLGLSMDVLLMCIYLRNTRLFHKFFSFL